MADYLTFKEIYEAIERAVSQSGSSTDYIKDVINMVYLNELLEADDLHPLYWLRKLDDTLAAKATATITGISAESPAVVTAVAHGYANGDLVSIYSVVGMTEVNDRMFLVSGKADDTFELETVEAVDVDSSGYTAYTSGGTLSHRGLTLATTGIDVKEIIQASFIDYQPMKVITPEQLEEKSSWWDDNTSRPSRYLMNKFFKATGGETVQLWWFPGSDDDYDLRYWASTRAARLSATTDVPLLPPKFHDSIISGSLTRLIESNVQVENAVIWPGLYKMQLENLRSFNRRYYADKEREGYYLL